MKRLGLFSILILTILLLAACGKADSGPQIAQTIELGEFAITPQELTLKVGDQVTLKIVNKGAIDHELMIGRDIHKDGASAAGFETDFFHSAGVTPKVVGGAEMKEQEHSHSGFMVVVPAGKEATVRFTVNDKMVGEWMTACFLGSGAHYTAGMQGKLIVVK